MINQVQNNNRDAMGQSKPMSLFLAIATLILLVAFTAYVQLSKSAVNDETVRLQADIKSLNDQIADLESKHVEAAQVAQNYLDQIKKDEIRWSGVLEKVAQLVPADANGQNQVNFVSYSGGEGGKLTMNAQTIAAKDEPYQVVADLISAFNTSPYFTSAYVPSLSRGEDDQGNKLLTFIFNTTYQENTPVADTTAGMSTTDASASGSSSTGTAQTTQSQQ